MPTCYFLKGLQGSGKSTWRRLKLASRNYHGIIAVNKDELRRLAFDGKQPGGKFDPKNEKFIEAAEMAIVREAISRKLDVIIDNTHLSERHEQRFRPIFEKAGYTFEVVTFFHVSLAECLERNAKRPLEEQVPEFVIRSMYNQFIAGKELENNPGTTPEPPKQTILQQDPSLPHAIIVDMDGTWAKIVSRGPYEETKCFDDEVNPAVQTIVDSVMASGKVQHILVCSGRTDKVYGTTMAWLHAKAGRTVDNEKVHLFMRKAGDGRSDAVVKREIWEENIKDKFYVDFVLDDRQSVVDLWRSLGLTCLQVAPGNF